MTPNTKTEQKSDIRYKIYEKQSNNQSVNNENLIESSGKSEKQRRKGSI